MREQPGAARECCLAVEGIGLAGALGAGAAIGCAAARVGMSRPTESYFESLDPDTGEPSPLSVHVFNGVTDGFSGVGRLYRLARPALDDLLSAAELSPGALSDCALVVHTSDDFYASVAYAVEASGDTSPAPDVLRAALPDELREGLDAFGGQLASGLLQRLGAELGIAPERQRLVRGGPAAFMLALDEARSLLNTRAVRRCAVVSVDAPADPRNMRIWSSLGLLKTGEYPVGRMAGEAAAAVLLGRGEEGALAWLDGWGVSADGPHRYAQGQPTGRALFSALEAARQHAARPFEGRVASVNLSGDEYRARELGGALVLLGASGQRADFDTWLPAQSFGDTGAASSAISVCTAVRAFARGYAHGREVMVMAIGDDGRHGACVVASGPRGREAKYGEE